MDQRASFTARSNFSNRWEKFVCVRFFQAQDDILWRRLDLGESRVVLFRSVLHHRGDMRYLRTDSQPYLMRAGLVAAVPVDIA